MALNKLSKLALAIAAAGFIGGPIIAAHAYEMSAASAVRSIGDYLATNDIAKAKALIARLKALGVTEIRIAGMTFTIADLERAVNTANNPASAALLAQVVNLASTSNDSTFVIGNVLVSSVESSTVLPPDTFPTGSTGVTG